MVEKADYEGYIELPKIRTSTLIPEKLIPFSKAMAKTHTDFDCWVMFYEYDIKFERLWHNPKQYLAKTFILYGRDGKTRTLYQLQGSLNGKKGVFEWIYDNSKGVTHRRFIPNGKITGRPNSR